MTTERSERAEAYAHALLTVVRAEGATQEVEDELFRFARVLEGSDELRLALTDPALPIERRQAVVDDLLSNKAMPTTKAVVAFIAGIGRTAELPAIVDRFVELAAEGRKHDVAEVRSAVALDDAQRKRLADALSKATGKQIEVKVIVDPTVLGGIVARVGDLVIDGSVRTRIEQLKGSL